MEALKLHTVGLRLKTPQRVVAMTNGAKTPDVGWRIDGVGALLHPRTYEDTFRPLLHGETFRSFLESRAFEKRFVLDLYGSGYTDIYTIATHVVAVRLANIDTYIDTPALRQSCHPSDTTMRSILRAPNRRVIEGNLLRSATWRKIYIDQFDLIVCRPCGPFEAKSIRLNEDIGQNDATAYLPIYLSLLNRAYRLLSHHNGMLLTQVPEFPQIRQLVDVEHSTGSRAMNSVPGISVEFASEPTDSSISYCMKLIKTPLAPPSLTPYFREMSIEHSIDRRP